METPDLLPNRLNFDVIVFAGCTMKEMQAIAIFSLVLCISFLGMLTKWLIHMFLVGMGLAFPAAVALSWGIALMVQRFKQDKPKGFVKQQFLLMLEDYHLVSPRYCRRSGYWSTGRFVK